MMANKTPPDMPIKALPKAKSNSEDWRTPTTYLQRFRDSMTLLCQGIEPPDEMLAGWLDGTSDELQHFAASHAPAWAQGIGAIDAAMLMADQPTEGAEHEMRDSQQEVPAVAPVPENAREAFEAWAPTQHMRTERWVVNPSLYDDENAISAWQGWEAGVAWALAATPALPATEHPSAGDLAEARHQTKLLAQALGDCIIASGIVRSDLEMSGPQLLMFAEDLKEQLLARQAVVQAEPVAWMRKTDITELTDSEPETDGWTPLYAAPQAQPADALDGWAEERRRLIDEAHENKYRARAFERDAARYRYIRDTPWANSPLGRVIAQHRNALWDTEIDAAMAAAQKGGAA